MKNKKYFLLICSLLYLIISFIYSWFKYDLENIISIFCIIPMLILLIIYFIILINCLKNIFNDKKYFDIITIIILILCVFIQFYFPFEESKLKLEWDTYKDKRYEIIKLVKEDKLKKIEDTQAYTLPDNLKKISQTGEVLVYKNDKYVQVIGFFIIRGMIFSGSKLLVYSSNNKNDILDNISNINEINKIKDNWYYIETSY